MTFIIINFSQIYIVHFVNSVTFLLLLVLLGANCDVCLVVRANYGGVSLVPFYVTQIQRHQHTVH